jgi:NAD(P)-dependent dehydrogenase (short-subunit alcohol dehydrogenase family)
MDLQLSGQVAVVIGAAQGIGAAIAELAGQEGLRVAWLDRDAAVVTRAAECGGLGLVADITEDASMHGSAARVAAELGPCEHLFVAAGAGSGKFGYPFWNLDPADWPRVLEVNLTGAVRALTAFQEQLLECGHGTALLLSSVAAQIGSQTDPPYSAAKAGLINFAQCAARDFAPHSARVNVICPGMVRTTLNQSVWRAWNERQPAGQKQPYDAWAEQKIRQICPLGRWQDAEDVAAAALFLASPRAKNITGQTINVDGGQVMH